MSPTQTAVTIVTNLVQTQKTFKCFFKNANNNLALRRLWSKLGSENISSNSNTNLSHHIQYNNSEVLCFPVSSEESL